MSDVTLDHVVAKLDAMHADVQSVKARVEAGVSVGKFFLAVAHGVVFILLSPVRFFYYGIKGATLGRLVRP